MRFESGSLDGLDLVVVDVWDVAGRHVARLLDEPLGEGEHRLAWDASGLSSGGDGGRSRARPAASPGTSSNANAPPELFGTSPLNGSGAAVAVSTTTPTGHPTGRSSSRIDLATAELACDMSQEYFTFVSELVRVKIGLFDPAFPYARDAVDAMGVT